MSAKVRITYSVIAYILGLSICMAQNVSNLKREYNQGLTLFYQEYYPEALESFLAISEIDSTYQDVPYKVEILQFMAGDYERSLETILAFKDTYGKEDKFYNYWLGQIFAKKYLFSEAIRSWEQFLDLEAYKSEEIINETRQFIEKAEASIEFFSRKSLYRVEALPYLNSDGDERFPHTFQQTQIAFLQIPLDPPQEQIVLANLKPYSQSTVLENLEFKVSGICMMDDKGSSLYLVNDKGEIQLSQEENGSWSTPEAYNLKLPKNKKGMDIHISEGGSLIFFTQGKKVNKQGLDLYIVRKGDNGDWGKPVPLPGIINTSKNQRSPYFSETNNTLYFSSDGFESIGGFDIFATKFDSTSNTWSTPERLPYPINTPNDELDFYTDESNVGYVSSNRLFSNGGFDIYQFRKIQNFRVPGIIVNENNEPVKDEIEVSLQSLSYEDEQNAIKTRNGKFKTDLVMGDLYSAVLKSKGRVILKDTFQLANNLDPESYTLSFTIPGQLDDQDESLSSNGGITYFYRGKNYTRIEAAVMGNLYFDFGVISKTKGSKQVLDELEKKLTDQKEIMIEIAGHTDNIGPADANLWVSRSRAQEVRWMLMQRGIAEERLIPRGYGERYPIASNDDEVDGRELNRRIEFYIVRDK